MTNLTEGRPLGVIWRFSVPLLLSTALQQAYNLADSVIVGQFTGAAGLAPIGAAYPVTLFYIAFATGAAMGCSVIISQLFGARRMRDLKSAVFTALISLAVMGMVLSVAGVFLSGPLMRLLHAPEESYGPAQSYLAIYSAGVLFMCVYNAANAIYTGLGDSKRPLYFLLMSSVLNIFLDIVAVGLLGLGAVGTAWATTISQAVAALLSITLITRKVLSVRTEERFRFFDRKLLGEMAKLAVPSIFQQSCVALSNTILQWLVNSFGDTVIAGYEVGAKLTNVAYMSLNTMGTALASFTAQCYGAKKYLRIMEGFRASLAVCICFAVTVIAVCQVFPRQLIGLFVDPRTEPGVIAVGVNYLRIVSIIYAFTWLIITTGGLLRGLGKSFTFFIETMIEFIIRISMCFVLTKALDSYTGLMWAWYFTSPTGFCMCLFLCLRERKRLMAAELELTGPG